MIYYLSSKKVVFITNLIFLAINYIIFMFDLK